MCFPASSHSAHCVMLGALVGTVGLRERVPCIRELVIWKCDNTELLHLSQDTSFFWTPNWKQNDKISFTRNSDSGKEMYV